ncbi:MAG: hypothetical protein DRI97_08260 [Bacteroidetes bacterium]|nr:MAG: hypothetical protein DRI97_08260 [Bacteroidota bacterium]
MTQRTILTTLLLVSFGLATFAQGKNVTVKITDLEKVTTTVQNASSSSSSSCGTSDFPVYQGTETLDVDIADLTWISVRHDLSPSDPNYIKLELTFKNGTTGIYEMVRYIRFTGKTEEGNFAIQVKDINTIEIVP